MPISRWVWRSLSSSDGSLRPRWKASAVRSPAFSTANPLRGLVQIDQRAAAFLRDGAQRAFERGVALAAGRAEDVAHQAVGVHAHQHWRVARFIARHLR